MFFNAREGHVAIDGTTMDYVEFGHGARPLILLPGLSDGLKTVRGLSRTLALSYRLFAPEFKVYVFSRKNELAEGYTTQDMARDQKRALDQLGIEKASVMGISQGGMIAQHLAIDYPNAVEKLVLGGSAPKSNETLREAVSTWIRFAEAGDYPSIILDTMERSYSTGRMKKYRLLAPLVTRVGNPQDFTRFLIQARACLTHDAWDRLGQIKCPALILGGDADNVVGKQASPQMADKIPGSVLIVYPGLGHAAYEETKDYNRQVQSFLLA